MSGSYIGNMGKMVLKYFMSYLLLHNKSPPNFVALNSKYLFFSHFLWIKNLEAAYLDSSGSGSLMQ